MRIAIVGAGVSGLTAYLFLVKHLPQPARPDAHHEYVIYESHGIEKRRRGQGTSEIPLVGVGLGIAANGMGVLHDLDEKIHRAMREKGFASTDFTIQNNRGWSVGSMKNVWSRGDQNEVMVMISRQDILDCLLAHVPDGVVQQRTVAVVKDGEKQKATIEFDDGTSELFDLVIGADGVRGKTRKAVLGEDNEAVYTGLYGVGGFVSTVSPSTTGTNPEGRVSRTVMTMGPNGFFGYSPCTNDGPITNEALQRGEAPTVGPRGFWWSTFERDNADTRNVDFDELRDQLRERHENWQDPTIRRIVQTPDLHMQGVATWAMSKAPTWTGRRVVLTGDAAHALPSTSGQGISQALLDSQTLALLLAHHLSRVYGEEDQVNEEDALRLALEQYVELRKPVVENILDKAHRMASSKKNQGKVQELLTFAVMKVIFTFFSDSFQKPLFEYDVKKEIDHIVRRA